MLKCASLFALLLCAGTALAQNDAPPPRGRPGPPQEAFDACKGKKDGDAAELKSKHGEAVKGTCRLVLIPSKPPGGEDAQRPAR